MTNTNTNAIGAMVQTLSTTPTKKPPTKKADKPVVTLGVDYANTLMASYVSSAVASETGLSGCNVVIQTLIDSSIKFVKLTEKSKKDTVEYKFTEQCKKEMSRLFIENRAKAIKGNPLLKPYPTAVLQGYWQCFAESVNSKKLLESFNQHRNKGKKGKDSKDSKDKTQEQLDKDMTKSLLSIWELSDASPKALTYIQNKLDTMTLIEAIADFLKSDGIVLPE
jgi:hypothetical protein